MATTPRQLPPDVTKYGQIVSSSGLIVPSSYQQADTRRALVAWGESALPDNGFNQGVSFPRDPNTMAVRFALKGSGRDDRMSEAIVDGNIANVGVTPVISAQISAAVRRQGNQAMNSTIDITGKRTPFNKARDAIARFDDNPLGVTDALELLVYRLCTYNRGSPISTVPLEYDFDTWGEYGMNAIPIVPEGTAESEAQQFWLEVDWSRAGTPTPFLPDPLDLEATGDNDYPFWYNASRQDGSRVWVLLHKTAIIPVIPGKSATSMIGTSPAWMCLGWLAENVLVMDERAEKMLYSLADGIYMLGGAEGIDPQKDILDKLVINRQAMFERGFKAGKPPAIIASPVDKVSIASITLRQPPGVEFKDWREYCEDVTAFCFGEPLSALVVRGGVGYGAQADAATENTMDSAIGAHLARIATALGAIYPRVSISVTRANDRAARLNIKTLSQYSGAAVQLITAGVITPMEARLIIDRDILQLPESDDLTAEANVTDDVDDGMENTTGDGSDDDGGGGAGDVSTASEAQKAETQRRLDTLPYALLSSEERAYLDGRMSLDELESQYPVPVSDDLQAFISRANSVEHGSAEFASNGRDDESPLASVSTAQTTDGASFSPSKLPVWFGSILADVDGVIITDSDVDRALLAARNRVDQTAFELLNATVVEA